MARKGTPMNSAESAALKKATASSYWKRKPFEVPKKRRKTYSSQLPFLEERFSRLQ